MDATGVAMVDRNGGLRTAKAPAAANVFMNRQPFLDLMADGLKDGATVMLGHNRKPTKGSAADDRNNHPIVVGDVVGIHNGTIENDDDVFDSELKHYHRQGSVDSEAIFALMNDIAVDQPVSSFVRAVTTAVECFLGTCTAMFFYRSRPDRLIVIKRDNQLSLHYDPELNILVFHSRYVFLRKAFGPAVMSEMLPIRSGFIFSSRDLARLGCRPVHHFALSRPAGSAKRRDCGCAGLVS
jgi:glucosamine 6-phosphate synthetase-like amidotransferase/phosphosugar isomerase protein